MPPIQKFIIAGTQRAGTSLINSTLNKHENIRCYGEVFLLKRGHGANMDGSYRRYLNENKFIRTLNHYINRRNTINVFLDQLYATSGYSAVGFKFMLGQAYRYPAVLDYLRENNVKAVHVVRENVLKTYISRYTAKKRNLYIVKENVEAKTVRLPVDNILAQLQQISREKNEWNHLLEGMEVMEVSYEKYVDERRGELARIQEFLKVPVTDDIETDVKKINPNDLSEFIENFEELTAMLVGTEFEKYL